MAMDTRTLFAQRRALLRAALEPLIGAGKLPDQVLVTLDQLYARHRYLEAERIAGLALWVGKESRTMWHETCFESFGTFLRASLTVVQGLAMIATQHAGDAPARDAFLSTCGLSPPFYTRCAQLGQRVGALTAESLPDRGRRVSQLLHWFSGVEAPTELGPRQAAVWSASKAVHTGVETAAAEALQAIHTVSHCLWQVWLQRAWTPSVSSCEVFLEQELGVGATLGQALIALGQERTVWDVHPHPLARLEVVVTLLAHPTTASRTATGD
ncbi:MAG: hypothetical protein HOP18_19445 [Deltaproteobacteria bacterium]|nr:hypothetical protein [Deltaproteobacteria bacterium]